MELLKLIGLPHCLEQGLHLITQCTVGLHVLQQALLFLLQHLQLEIKALNELLLWVQHAGLSHGPADLGTLQHLPALPGLQSVQQLVLHEQIPG